MILLLIGNFVDYYDVSKPVSFSGIHSFAKVSKKPEKWLKTRDTYTLHFPVRKRFQQRKTIVPGGKFQMQADLIDFSALKQFNDGYKYIVVLTDVFSKVAYAECIKNKSSNTMISAFCVLLKKLGHFHKLQTDRGSKFLNKPFQAWLRKQKIELFHCHNYEIKASIAERFIRTIKEKLWRYFTHKNTRRYIDVIQSVDSYNNSYHSSIKRTPASVNTENQETVWLTFTEI